MPQGFLRLAIPLLIAGLFHVSQAAAHGSGPDFLPEDGIAIASLTHGQMAVLERHRAAILTLAGRHYPPDDRLRRLANYAALQRSWCLWGLMPGTISDETSPFNLCGHAYLAATRDALLRLQELRPGDAKVTALVDRIDYEMMSEGSALVLCGFSADAFSTAVMIRPDWPAVPFHWPSLAALLTVAFLMAAALFLLRKPRGLPRRAGLPDS